MRPDFGDIIAKLHDLKRSKFASINPDAFLTLQQSWKEEVRVKFEEFKKKEEVCVCACVCVMCACAYFILFYGKVITCK